MITRKNGCLQVRSELAPMASEQLERDGYTIIRGVLTSAEVSALSAEISAAFETSGIDRERDAHDEWRYGMLNRSPLSQEAIGKREILDVIEPLLGEDCHVIANTAWRNRIGHTGGSWHIDTGPHVPRKAGVPWPDDIPYPVFAIGVHIFLKACSGHAGPTAVLPGSHRSGLAPPRDRRDDPELRYDEREPVMLIASAGDAAMFVSDIWHRGTAAAPGHDRFFLQCHYGRRDLAQRIRTTGEVNHLSLEAILRTKTERERTLIGLHAPRFYDK